MDRRQFCRSAAAVGVAGSYPWWTGCVSAGPGVPAVSLDGAEIELERAAVNELSESLTGSLMHSAHPEYDTARMIWNGMHDKRPALIARCQDSQDVSNAVTFARERDLLVAVRGGGHSWPGKSVCDGGLMIDLSQMNTVEVDPGTQRAHARGGALLYTLDAAAREHGLITTAGVVSHTGVGGYTLGGGFGRLNRKYGLTIDNLRSAEIVTADGEVRRISEEQDADLFWAIRGGGGNFGVVTEFEYQLHPFELEVLSGNVVWPIEQAKEVLDFYADWYHGLSDDLYVAPAMTATPDGQGILMMEVVYAGDPSAGEREVAPLLGIGQPMANGVGLNDYLVMQTSMDGAVHTGIRSYAKSGMIGEITPAVVEAMLEAYRADPRLFVGTHTAGGAVGRVDETATAFPHRNAETLMVFASFWEDPAEDEEVIARTREWYAQLEPFMGGYYTNIEFELDGTASGNYGPVYERLAQIKGQHDPTNLFRLNSNVQPAG
jgi:hypothetical protein